MPNKLLNLLLSLFVAIVFCLSLGCDVLAQTKKPKYQPKYHPESDLLNCKKLGVPKIKEARISKRQQRAWAARAKSRNGGGNSLTAPSEDSMSASLDGGLNENVHTDSSEDVLGSSAASDSQAVINISASPIKQEKLKGSDWFTQGKATIPDAKFLLFSKDSDPFVDTDLTAIQEAVQHTKFGYYLVITQFIPESDIKNGSNTAFERVNRLKTMVANKFKLSPHQIMIKTGEALENRPKGIMVSLLEE